MIKMMKVIYESTNRIDTTFEKELADFIREKLGMNHYASGFNFETGLRDIVFDSKADKQFLDERGGGK